jgi:hypothetical protein
LDNVDGYVSSDYVLITNKAIFAMTNFRVGESSSAYAFYNSSKEYISSVANISGNIYVDSIPTNAKYVRFCSQQNSTYHPVVTLFNADTVEQIYNQIGNTPLGTTATTITGAIAEHGGKFTDIANEIKGIAIDYSLYGFLSTSGVFVSNNSYRATDFVPIGGKTYFSLTNVKAGASSLIYAFYDENKAFAAKTRRSIIDMARNKKLKMYGMHFPGTEPIIFQ